VTGVIIDLKIRNNCL